MNSKLLLLFSLAAASVLPAARAGAAVDITAEIRLGRALPPPPPEVVVVERVGPPGPPPWAEHHWYRRSYAYYYYPEADVYYRPADHVWFFLDRGEWRFAARLPDSIRMDFGRAVALTLESDRPYVFHDRVVAYYPQNYFTRVRIRDDRDRHDDHHDHDDRDRHDRDHDRRR